MKKNSFLGIIIAFIVGAVLVGFVYYTGRQRKPMVYSRIPLATTQWTEVLKTFKSLNISVVPKGPFNWNNKEDFGQIPNTGWQRVDTDPSFLVYYKNDAMHLNVQNARRVLQIANEAIPEIQELMGTYPFPDNCNGRRLAIYITSSPAEYQTTVDKLSGGRSNSAGSAAMLVTHVGPLGCLADGIVLHPVCFDYESDPSNWAETTLRHEMNHYAYFLSLDYSKELNHPLWVSEGLAEYFSVKRGQIVGKDSIEYIAANCKPMEEFPMETKSQYWAGRSFYQFVEDTKGMIGLKDLIQTLYKNDIETTLALSFEDAAHVDSLWVKDMLEKSAAVDSLATENPAI